MKWALPGGCGQGREALEPNHEALEPPKGEGQQRWMGGWVGGCGGVLGEWWDVRHTRVEEHLMNGQGWRGMLAGSREKPGRVGE